MSSSINDLKLLEKVTDTQLQQWIKSYKQILLLAKLVLPFLIVAILLFCLYQSGIITPSAIGEGLRNLIAIASITCAIVFVILVPIAFINIYALKQQVHQTAERLTIDKNMLLLEFSLYLHRIIKNHYGISFG